MSKVVICTSAEHRKLITSALREYFAIVDHSLQVHNMWKRELPINTTKPLLWTPEDNTYIHTVLLTLQSDFTPKLIQPKKKTHTVILSS